MRNSLSGKKPENMGRKGSAGKSRKVSEQDFKKRL